MKCRECSQCWWPLPAYGRIVLASSVQACVNLVWCRLMLCTMFHDIDRVAVCRPWKKKRRKNSRCHLWPGVHMDIYLSSSSD